MGGPSNKHFRVQQASNTKRVTCSILWANSTIRTAAPASIESATQSNAACNPTHLSKGGWFCSGNSQARLAHLGLSSTQKVEAKDDLCSCVRRQRLPLNSINVCSHSFGINSNRWHFGPTLCSVELIIGN